jgi:hypothetical protein
MNKYEQLIEYIINDQEDKARELFHNIVVEKSRDIYESLMADEQEMDETVDHYDQAGDLVDEITADEDGGLSEDDLEVGDQDAAMGGDDLGGDDLGGDEFGGDEFGGEPELGGEEGSTEEKFQSIKDAIADLEAEFQELVGGEEGTGSGSASGSGEEFGGEEEFGSEEGGEEAGEENGEEFAEAAGSGKSGSGRSGSGKSGSGMMEAENPFAKKGSGKSGSGKSGSGKSGSGKSGSGKSGSGKGAMSEAEMMREYVEKISAPSNTEFTPAGTGTGGDKASGNTKGIVAGKNDMGGTAANIAKGGSEQAPDGTSPKGKASGFVKSAQEIDVAKRNVNKVGGNKGAQDFYNTKAKAKAGEGQTTDGSVAVNKHSIEGGKK